MGKIRTYKDGVAIVTGGASGIGCGLARELASRGCEVVIGDRQDGLAGKVADEINNNGGIATAAKVDVSNRETVEKLVSDTVERCGRLDYIFNNAGIGVSGEVAEHSSEDWDAIIDVNLKGVVNGVEAAYKIMREQGFGHIVNTSSMAGLCPTAGLVSYCATKYAVVGLSTSLRVEAEQYGVMVSVLCPGVVKTAILDGGKYHRELVDISDELKDKFWKIFRPISPEKFAGKVLNQVAANRQIIIVPSWWRMGWWLQRISPALACRFARLSFGWARKQLEEDQITGNVEEA